MKNEDKKEFIIPGVSGIISFLANKMNQLPRDNVSEALIGVEKYWPIAYGRTKKMPLEELVQDNMVISNDNKKETNLAGIHKGRTLPRIENWARR